MKNRLVETNDGSFTMHSEHFDECYHSTKDGALRESLKKHVEPAFSLLNCNEITILDICFGLGYNTLSTLYYIDRKKLSKRVKIISPELDENLVRSLGMFPYPSEFKPYIHIIRKIADSGHYEDHKVAIEVVFKDAREFIRECDTSFDIIYQDAFSPKKNPTLWTKEYFLDLTSLMRPHAILTTYSSATPVRMGMYESGLNLYFPHKSEVRSGTIASLSPNLPLEKIDMELKVLRNPFAAPLLDAEIS
ncbi:MAG: hypothetical protein L3J42_03295 [Hydrogenimonas sp.]|nr:hypothetical protein [Hydrogenimonas sp.]